MTTQGVGCAPSVWGRRRDLPLKASDSPEAAEGVQRGGQHLIPPPSQLVSGSKSLVRPLPKRVGVDVAVQ